MQRITQSLACVAFAGATLAAQQFTELGKRYLPIDAAVSHGQVFGDVDGDGDLDLVPFGARAVSPLYLNDGGVFTNVGPTHMPPSGDSAVDVALGDIDGDGDLDMVRANGGSYLAFGLRTYLNDGTGRYTNASNRLPHYTGEAARAIALVDVDGDGDLDAVYSQFAVRLALNDGTGTFVDATAQRLPPGDGNAIAAGDVDADGDLDLVIGRAGVSRLYVNDGTGTFNAITARMPGISSNTLGVALGDVDADGDLDVMLANYSSRNLLYLNDGRGTFVDATASRLPPDADATTEVILVDIDRDGDLDAAVAKTGRQNRLWVNDGVGVFTDVTDARLPLGIADTSGVAAADVDGDGDVDLVFANQLQQSQLFLNDGTGRFIDVELPRMPREADLGAYVAGVALGDIDHDGDLDAVFGRAAAGRTAQDQLFLNDGSGTFTDATSARLPLDTYSAQALALVDVDRDGDLDIVTCNSVHDRAEQTRLLLNDGAGFFTDVSATHMPGIRSFARDLAVGDIDGDGDVDLVQANHREQNRLFANDGTGRFVDVTSTHLPVDSEQTEAVVLGDVDGDGDLDIVFSRFATTRNALYLNDGSGRFTDVSASHLPDVYGTPLKLLLADLDGDRDLDLFVADYYSASTLQLNDGTGRFTLADSSRIPRWGAIHACADVDLDGDLDLLGGNALHLNDGTATFTDASQTRMRILFDGATSAMALGDVDADGDLDVVRGVYPRGTMSGSLRVQSRQYVNLHRQLDAQLLARIDRTWRLDYYAQPGYGTAPHLALPFLSPALAATPLPVPPFGTLFLEPTVLLPLPWVSIPFPSGIGSGLLRVPLDRGLVGQRFYAQALIVALFDPADTRLTNHARELILD